MEIKWHMYKGKNILEVNYTGIILDKEMIDHLNNAVSVLKTVKPGETLRFFSDVTGCFATPGFLEAAKKADKELHTQYKVKAAVIGIAGAKAILLKAYNVVAKAKTQPVLTKEEAMEYLSKN